MKYLLFILLSLSLIGCGSKEKKTSLTKENIKGKVKYIEESTYNVIDKFGNIEKVGLSKKEIFKYDEKGNKTEENLYNSNESLSKKITFKYDEEGKLIEENLYNSDESLKNKAIYNYDKKGNLIELIWYNANGSFNCKYTYNCDEKGNIMESNDNLANKVTFKYDSKGNKIEEKTFSYDRLNYGHFYKYDEKGNKIEENGYYFGFPYPDAGKLDYKEIYINYENGNVIEWNRYNSDGYVYNNICKYEYDNEGNWIKVFVKNIKNTNIYVSTKERHIEYYK